MKTKPETEMFIKRKKRNENGDYGFEIIKNRPQSFDLSELADFVYLQTRDNGMEEWVHKDDYGYYKDTVA